jgi:beta-glucanase (GH16 family)
MLDVGCFLIFVFLALAPAAFAAPPAGYHLAWSDEFNGTALDTNKWDYWLPGRRRNAVNSPDAVSFNGSNLVITTYTSNQVHYSAFVATDRKFRPRYGYWEASIKWSDTNGTWSAFWMQSPTMGANHNDPQASGSEIDIAEHRYVDGDSNNIASQVQVNIHWNGYGSATKSCGSGNVGAGLATGFHTYGFLWTTNAYAFQIDGSPVYHGGSSPVSHSPEWVILSSEVDDTSTKWAGFIPAGGYGDPGASAAKLTVDYVRYYAPDGETPDENRENATPLKSP